MRRAERLRGRRRRAVSSAGSQGSVFWRLEAWPGGGSPPIISAGVPTTPEMPRTPARRLTAAGPGPPSPPPCSSPSRHRPRRLRRSAWPRWKCDSSAKISPCPAGSTTTPGTGSITPRPSTESCHGCSRRCGRRSRRATRWRNSRARTSERPATRSAAAKTTDRSRRSRPTGRPPSATTSMPCSTRWPAVRHWPPSKSSFRNACSVRIGRRFSAATRD